MGLPTSTFYRDADTDTFGNPSVTRTACNLAQAGAGYVANNTDCNDANAAIKPSATEVCNGIDDNCTGGIDNGLPATTFYRDADGDTFGSAATTKSACSLAVAGAGYVDERHGLQRRRSQHLPGRARDLPERQGRQLQQRRRHRCADEQHFLSRLRRGRLRRRRERHCQAMCAADRLRVAKRRLQ